MDTAESILSKAVTVLLHLLGQSQMAGEFIPFRWQAPKNRWAC